MDSTVNSQEVYKLTFKEKLRNFYSNQKGWVYILPILVLLAIFTFYPLIRTSIYAFQNNYDSLSNTYDGWGFENFKRIIGYFNDKGEWVSGYGRFKYNLANTLLFSIIAVPISTLLALFISVGLNSIKWVQKLYQTVFFLPYLTNALAIGAVFATMFQVVGTGSVTFSYGLINQIFGTKIDWLSVTESNIWYNRIVVIVYEIWSGLPFKILILFGALQNVNKQYYDAAKIDGASKHRILWRITVPLISPMLSYLIITGFIGGFKAYTAVVGIYGASTVEHSIINTMVGFIYDNIGAGSTGIAAAGALILFVLILFFTLINLYVSKKRVHY